MTKDLKELSMIELIYDDIVDDKDIIWRNFIYHWWYLYPVLEINWQEVTSSWWLSNIKFLIEPSIKEVWDFKYIILDYPYSNKAKIIYKDITYESTYYWDLSIWLTKHYPMIENYFFNIIDEKVSEAIEAIEIDSSSVLAIVNKYKLPVSRDLMLTKAIDKYATEMAELLNAINDADLKKSMWSILDTIKWFITPSKIITTKATDLSDKKLKASTQKSKSKIKQGED